MAATRDAVRRDGLGHGDDRVILAGVPRIVAADDDADREILRMVGQVEGAPEAPSKDELLALSTAASISTREQEVLRLIAAGLSNREIAARLSVSHSTVKTHVENIYLKLGVNGRMQAVAQAQALKLV